MLEPGRVLEREELLGDLARLRRAATAGAILWPCFGLMDYLVVSHLRPGLAALVLFALNLAFILGTLAFSVVGGHSAWQLRWQLFEARSVGRYRLLECIGKGGMGEVWSALHPGLKRHVAMKILQAAHRWQEPTPPSRRRSQPLPPRLEAFILRNLSKDPRQRSQSAVEFARDLAALS